MNISEETSLPTPEEFYVRSGLYREFKHDGTETVYSILKPSIGISAHCIQCNRTSIFNVKEYDSRILYRGPSIGVGDPPPYPRYYATSFVCALNSEHSLVFIVQIEERNFQKVGQYPSFGDIHIHDVDKYSKVLTKSQRQELATAIGLHAHGVGIGSYVYLRRIIESMVEEAHAIASQSDNWDEESYQRLRMMEKITLIKHHLPDALSANSPVYSILSKGIHSLSEDECKQYFPALLATIRLILDDKLAALQRDRDRADLNRSINELNAKLKGS